MEDAFCSNGDAADMDYDAIIGFSSGRGFDFLFVRQNEVVANIGISYPGILFFDKAIYSGGIKAGKIICTAYEEPSREYSMFELYIQFSKDTIQASRLKKLASKNIKEFYICGGIYFKEEKDNNLYKLKLSHETEEPSYEMVEINVSGKFIVGYQNNFSGKYLYYITNDSNQSLMMKNLHTEDKAQVCAIEVREIQLSEDYIYYSTYENKQTKIFRIPLGSCIRQNWDIEIVHDRFSVAKEWIFDGFYLYNIDQDLRAFSTIYVNDFITDGTNFFGVSICEIDWEGGYGDISELNIINTNEINYGADDKYICAKKIDDRLSGSEYKNIFIISKPKV